MDQELIAYLEQRFNSMDQRFDRVEGRLDSMEKRLDSHDQRFDQIEETVRHTDIKVEALRDEIRLVAEAVDLNDKKTERRFQELKQEIADVRSLVTISYTGLDRRVTTLEKAS